jgi:hypothetical protein
LIGAVDDVAPANVVTDCVDSRMTPSVSPSRPTLSPYLVHFRSKITLTKREVFEACERLDSARSVLLSHGHREEALGLSVLFQELESRVATTRKASAP